MIIKYFFALVIALCVVVSGSQMDYASKPELSFRDCYIGQAAFRVIHQRNTIVLKIVDNTLSDLYLTASLNNAKKRKKVLLSDFQGKTTPVSSDMYNASNIDQLFSLPTGFDIKDIASFGLFSRSKNIQVCEMPPLSTEPNPYPIILEPLQGRNGLRSTQVTLLNPTMIEVKGLTFKALAPGAFFYVGSQDRTGNNIKLLDNQTGRTEPLKRAKNKKFTLRLPDGLDITKFDQFGIWSTGINRSLSHVDIKHPETNAINQQERPTGPNQKCRSRRKRSLRTPANNADMPNFEHFPKKRGFGKDSIDKPIEPKLPDTKEANQRTSQKPWADLKKRQDLSVEAQTLPTDNVIERIDNDEDYNDDDDTNLDNDVDCYEQSSSTTERQMGSMELLKNSKSSSSKSAPMLSQSVVIQPSPQAPNRHALANKTIYNMEPFEEIKPANEQAPAWQKYWRLNHMVANYSDIDEHQLVEPNHVPSKEGPMPPTPKADENSINLFEKSKLISQLKERLKNRKTEMASLVSSNQFPFSKSKTRKPPLQAHFHDPVKKAEKFFAMKNKLIAERRNRPFALEKTDRYKASEKSSDFRSYLSDLLSPIKRLLQSALGYPSDLSSRRVPQVKRKLFLPWEQTRLPSPTRRSHRRRKPHLTMARSQIKHIHPGNVPKPMPTPAYVGKNLLQSHMLAIHHQTKRKTQEDFMEEPLRNRNQNPFFSHNKIGPISSTLSPKSKPKNGTVTTVITTTATTTKTTTTAPPTPLISGQVEGSVPASSSSSTLDEFRPILPLVNGGALPALAFNVLDSSEG